MCFNLTEKLMDAVINVSDDEIKAIASMSHKIEAKIYETKSKEYYFLKLAFDNDDEKVLISSSDLDEYKELSKEFFKKFIKFGGNISLDEIFFEKPPLYTH